MSHLDPDNQIRSLGDQCKLIVVQDQLQACPYIDNATSRMPLQLPVGKVTPEITDRLLELGYRRSGDFVYRTQCPACSECKPTRVAVDTFRMTSSMRRVFNRGERELTCQWNLPSVDSERVEMFNHHRVQRNLGSGEVIDASSYGAFLIDTCCDTQELAIYLGDELIAIAIVDLGMNSVSAVYTHFKPTAGRYSLGTYAILKQIQWATANDKAYVYLGMYVASNDHLNYKAKFAPQQRLDNGRWSNVQ